MNNQSQDTFAPLNKKVDGPEVRRKARDEFVRVVAQAVDQLIAVDGCSRERATALVLREIAETTANSDNELTYAKQHYRLSHIQATRALAVSTAVKNLVKNEHLSQSEAVNRLTQKLASASFSNVDASAATNADSNSQQAVMSRKASEISIPQIPKQQQQSVKPPAKTPVKKARSTGGKPTALKAATKPTRKRSVDEIGANNTQLTAEPQPTTETRARSDSVTEAVTAKLMHQEPSMNAENVKPPPRNKRSRGGSNSLDDSDSGSNAKRVRPSTA